MERKELKIFFIWPTFTEIGRDLSHLACGGGIRGNVEQREDQQSTVHVFQLGWRAGS
jgi:hypothetical protein